MQSTDIPPGVKKEAAKQEPAWTKCDNIEVGLKIWRVVKFKVSYTSRPLVGLAEDVQSTMGFGVGAILGTLGYSLG